MSLTPPSLTITRPSGSILAPRASPTKAAAEPRASKKDYDKAIADRNEALRLDPGHPRTYNNRGIAWSTRRITTRPLLTTTKPSGSIPGMDAPTTVVAMPGGPRRITTRPLLTTTKPSGSILVCTRLQQSWQNLERQEKLRQGHCRLQPGHPALPWVCTRLLQPRRGISPYRIGESGRGRAKVLELEGWRGEYSQYAVLWGYFGLRRAGNADSAKRLLDDAAARCDPRPGLIR